MSAFPISALVGADDVRLALLLCAIDPAIGGVLLRGDKGSGKTTAARGLAAVLADDAPFVELPLGATEDRVVGSLDLEAAFGGGYRFRPGLLSAADRGVLYVDEVNLLADHLVDLLLDAAATGEVRVERDGVSEAHRSRFVLVGSMNPEEGELRPQLLDRFGLAVSSTAPSDPPARAEAVRRRLAFDADPVAFSAKWAREEAALKERLAAAVPVPLEAGLEQRIGELCAAARAQGLRADLVICRASAALAGWEGRAVATMDEVRRVAPLALAHRRNTPWDEPTNPDSFEELMDDIDSSADKPGGRQSYEGDTSAAQDKTGVPDGPSSSTGSGKGPSGQRWTDPDGLPTQGLRLDFSRTDVQRAARAGGGDRRAQDAAGGRVVGSTAPTDGARGLFHPTATVLSAIERRSRMADSSGSLALDHSDLKVARREVRAARLMVLAVDTSGSMGASERVVLAQDAVMSVLVDAYQRRNRVALVTFHGEEADVVLRATGSSEVAKKRMAGLPIGGTTPLAAGIQVAHQLARAGRHDGYQPVITLITDGRATWSANGTPREAAMRAASAVKVDEIDAVVVDCEGPSARLGLSGLLAEAMGAVTIDAEALSGEQLATVMKDVGVW